MAQAWQQFAESVESQVSYLPDAAVWQCLRLPAPILCINGYLAHVGLISAIARRRVTTHDLALYHVKSLVV